MDNDNIGRRRDFTFRTKPTEIHFESKEEHPETPADPNLANEVKEHKFAGCFDYYGPSFDLKDFEKK